MSSKHLTIFTHDVSTFLLMFQTIKCTQLDFDDTTFLMSYPLNSPSVCVSVGTVGVVNPIVLRGCACEGKYQIVMGFRRAFACRELGIPVVNAHISQMEPAPSGAAFFLALQENLSHRRFNDVEKSIILTKLLNQFECPQDEVLRKYMPILHLAPNTKILESYLKIAGFEESIKQYIAEHDVPIILIDRLSSLTSENRQAVFDVITQLKLGTNKIKDLLTYLEEISLRDGGSIHTLLQEEELQAILGHEKYSTPQKADHLRRWLHEKRYPQFTVLEQTYRKKLKTLGIPDGVRLTTNRFFEEDTLNASLTFQQPEQLKKTAEELLNLSERPELQDVLNVIQGKNGPPSDLSDDSR